MRQHFQIDDFYYIFIHFYWRGEKEFSQFSIMIVPI